MKRQVITSREVRERTSAQDGLPDNTYLRELNEATLLHNVRTRYNDTKDDGGCGNLGGRSAKLPVT